MATEYLTNATDLKAVADAIRTKAGSTAQLSFPDGFVTAVNGIQTGGGVADQVWVWNDIPTYHTNLDIGIDFVNSGITYDVLVIRPSGSNGATILYAHSDGTSTFAFDGHMWVIPAYRAIVFKTPPTGSLLNYLRENATPMQI